MKPPELTNKQRIFLKDQFNAVCAYVDNAGKFPDTVTAYRVEASLEDILPLIRAGFIVSVRSNEYPDKQAFQVVWDAVRVYDWGVC